MLQLPDVSRQFGGSTAVDNVSMSVGRGEIVGLIGPNGAGKTTLFNLIAGTVKPSSGEILSRRRDGAQAPLRRLAQGLGRTFQIPRPFAEMTLLENLLVAVPQQTGERLIPNWLAAPRSPRKSVGMSTARSLSCNSSHWNDWRTSRRGYSRADNGSCSSSPAS